MNVTILGCGVYGLALANVFLENNNKVCMWSKFEKETLELEKKYLNINFTVDMELAVKTADLVVIAIPIAFLNDTMEEFKEIYNAQDILIASKGIEITNQLFAREIVGKCLGDVPIGVLSGGTFAEDMSKRQVMGITLATRIERIKDKVRNGLETNFLKVQYVEDIIGVSVCGAIKNVMAIGFGLLDGAKYSPSSKFLFLTEAIYEIRDLIIALGGDENTIMSYAGIDDIMMTCTSIESRNYTLGSMIGKECSIDEINTYKENTTIEGLGTSMAIYELIRKKKINLPIATAIYNILYNNGNLSQLINLLEKNS